MWAVYLYVILTAVLSLINAGVLLYYFNFRRRDMDECCDYEWDEKHPLFPISIILPTYNDELTIRSTIESIVNQNYPNKIQLIVVNDGSTDATNTEINYWLKENNIPSNVTVVYKNLTTNTGRKSKAMNTVVDLVEHDYMVTLDGDGVLNEFCLANLMYGYVVHSDASIVSGRVVISKDKGDLCEAVQDVDHSYSYAFRKNIQSITGSVINSSGAIMCIKMDDFRVAHGGKFNENMIVEDIVMSYGNLIHGFNNYYSLNSVVHSAAQPTFKQLYKQRKRWQYGIFELIIQFFHDVPKLVHLPFKRAFIMTWHIVKTMVIDIMYLLYNIAVIGVLLTGDFELALTMVAVYLVFQVLDLIIGVTLIPPNYVKSYMKGKLPAILVKPGPVITSIALTVIRVITSSAFFPNLVKLATGSKPTWGSR